VKVAKLGPKMIGLGVVTLGAALILLYYFQAAGGTLPFSGHQYTVAATVAEPQGLQKHADVRAAGVRVGSVSDVTPSGSHAVIRMRLDKTIAPLYRDATVLMRQKTLVGENYIEITRGHPQSGVQPDGSSLPISQDFESVPLDRILNSLDAPTRARVSANLRSLGAGFAGRGPDVNRMLSALRPTLSDGTAVTAVLDEQRAGIADIVTQAGTVFGAVAQRQSEMHTLIRSANATARAVAGRDAALRDALAAAPQTLTQARSSVAKLSAFAGRATPVVDELGTGLSDLHPVLRDLRPTADQARALFDRLPPLLRVADPMLSRLRTFSRDATPVLPSLDAMLRQANPALDYLKPYSRDLVGFLANFGGNLWYDKYGGIGYCACPVSDRSFSNWTPAMRRAAGVLIDEGLLARVTHVENNPVRKPGSLPDASAPFSGTYPRVTGPKP
jgi:phospholipid/cholesterol/gamma-HCH transport system substrate-binding protein